MLFFWKMFSIYRMLRYLFFDKTDNVPNQTYWKFSWRRTTFGLFSFIFLGRPLGAAAKLNPDFLADSGRLLINYLETWRFYQACAENVGPLFKEIIYEVLIAIFPFIAVGVFTFWSIYTSNFPGGLLKYLPLDVIYDLVTAPDFLVAAFIAFCAYDWVCFLYSEGECNGKFLARVWLSTLQHSLYYVLLLLIAAYTLITARQLYSYCAPVSFLLHFLM